jgi:hypothetical protein
MESPKRFEPEVGFSGWRGKSGFSQSLPGTMILTKMKPLGCALPRGFGGKMRRNPVPHRPAS